jgi:hypothetical protein
MTELFLRILFFTLATVIVFPSFPLRWSIFAYLLIVHLNLSRGEFTSAISLGLENSIKSVILPTVLFIRVRFSGFRLSRIQTLYLAGALFVLYAVISSAWTPFRIPAIKQLGYFYSYVVTIPVFVWLFHSNKRSAYKVIIWAAIFSIILAIVKFLLAEQSLTETGYRFASFSAKQSFALYLVLIISIIIAIPRKYFGGLLWKSLTLAIMVFSLFINESRTGFISILIIISFSILWILLVKPNYRRVYFILAFGAVLSSMAFFIYLGTPSMDIQKYLTQHRPFQVIATAGRNYSLRDIGTLNFRFLMYHTIIDRIKHKSVRENILGSGTSSAAELVIEGDIYYRGYDEYTVDANRVVHNEFLRVFYEWGLVGSVFFLSLLFGLLKLGINLLRRETTFEIYMLVVGLILLILFLMVENILAGSGRPVGTGLCLLVAYLFSFYQKKPKEIP